VVSFRDKICRILVDPGKKRQLILRIALLDSLKFYQAAAMGGLGFSSSDRPISADSHLRLRMTAKIFSAKGSLFTDAH